MTSEDDYEWDPAKRNKNLAHHGIDFDDARRIWAGPTLEQRSDHAHEDRFISFGMMDNRAVAVVWTPRDGRRRIISARGASRHERQAFAEWICRSPEAADPDGCDRLEPYRPDDRCGDRGIGRD
ncbi:MAG TPA: BrnT family toxin [Acetobacteraceae bacterium]|nr:BrnT family toxin [Acetobacteraceae bacterium]